MDEFGGRGLAASCKMLLFCFLMDIMLLGVQAWKTEVLTSTSIQPQTADYKTTKVSDDANESLLMLLGYTGGTAWPIESELCCFRNSVFQKRFFSVLLVR